MIMLQAFQQASKIQKDKIVFSNANLNSLDEWTWYL